MSLVNHCCGSEKQALVGMVTEVVGSAYDSGSIRCFASDGAREMLELEVYWQ